MGCYDFEIDQQKKIKNINIPFDNLYKDYYNTLKNDYHYYDSAFGFNGVWKLYVSIDFLYEYSLRMKECYNTDFYDIHHTSWSEYSDEDLYKTFYNVINFIEYIQYYPPMPMFIETFLNCLYPFKNKTEFNKIEDKRTQARIEINTFRYFLNSIYDGEMPIYINSDNIDYSIKENLNLYMFDYEEILKYINDNYTNSNKWKIEGYETYVDSFTKQKKIVIMSYDKFVNTMYTKYRNCIDYYLKYHNISKLNLNIKKQGRDCNFTARTTKDIFNNKCSICGCNAPNINKKDPLYSPHSSMKQFFHLHHIKRVGEGGENTLDNALLLCPNCHYKLHLGALGISEEDEYNLNRKILSDYLGE